MSMMNREIDSLLSVVNSVFLTSAVSQLLRLVEITNRLISKDDAVMFAVQFVTDNFSILSEFNTEH